MTYSKQLFLILLLQLGLFAGNPAVAQNWEQNHANEAGAKYVRASFGYGFRFAGQVDFKGYPADGSLYEGPSDWAINYRKYSFGTGPTANFSVGWIWNRWFGAELGVTAVTSPVKLHYDYFNGNGLKPDGNPDTTHMLTATSAQPIYATLAICGKTSSKRFNSYGRIGIAIPLKDNVTQVEYQDANTLLQGNIPASEAVFEFKSRFSIGLQGAVGISYAIGPHMEICAEAFGLLRNAYAKSSDLKSYKVDGITQNGPRNGYDHVDYEFSLTAQKGVTQLQTFVLPFSTLGMSVCLKYTF